MRSTAAGLYAFWNGFDIPAWPENGVPDDATLPYVTYEVKRPHWRGEATYTARLWYRDTSYEDIADKIDQIADAIGEGIRIPITGGTIWLFKDPGEFVQMQPVPQDDDIIKVAYLQMIIHVIA